MPFLPEIDTLGYNYYFQFTLNHYGKNAEPNVPDKDYLIEIFKQLSTQKGKEKVIWRYDPIFFTDTIDEDWHCASFGKIANQLKGYTEKCVISFVDMYTKLSKKMQSIHITPPDEHQQFSIANKLNNIALSNGMKIETCAEKISLEHIGIPHGQCISDILISKLIGKELLVSKDKTQREACGCVKSIDIGANSTCQHQCLYCYANYSEKIINQRTMQHNVNSPLLIGEPAGDETITDRKMESFLKSC
jgi:hypothetical protein